MASMAASRLSHSAAGEGVDTRSLFERAAAADQAVVETVSDFRKSILPVLPESDHEDLDDVGARHSFSKSLSISMQHAQHRCWRPP